MRISVVVPVINGMPFIVKTVASLKMISKSLEMEVIFQDADHAAIRVASGLGCQIIAGTSR